MSDSRPTHARKGREGKGVGREEESLLHASYLTEGAVGNPPASAIDPGRAASWMQRLRRSSASAMRRLGIRLTCNWLAIGFHCWRHGHDWRVNRPSRCVNVTTCAYCGLFRGWRHTGDSDCRWWRAP